MLETIICFMALILLGNRSELVVSALTKPGNFHIFGMNSCCDISGVDFTDVIVSVRGTKVKLRVW